MRSFFIFLLGCIIWIILGAFFSYDFLMDTGLENFEWMVNNSLNKIYSGTIDLREDSGKLLKERVNNIKTEINQKKEEFKQNLLQNIKKYLENKINNIFWFSKFQCKNKYIFRI